MKQPIYIFSDGKLQRRQNTLSFVDKEGKKKYVPVENASALYIFGGVDFSKRKRALRADSKLHPKP